MNVLGPGEFIRLADSMAESFHQLCGSGRHWASGGVRSRASALEASKDERDGDGSRWVGVKRAQAPLGHSDPRLILAIYAQATSEADRAAADLLVSDSFPGAAETPAEGSPDARWNRTQHQGPPLRTALTWCF